MSWHAVRCNFDGLIRWSIVANQTQSFRYHVFNRSKRTRKTAESWSWIDGSLPRIMWDSILETHGVRRLWTSRPLDRGSLPSNHFSKSSKPWLLDIPGNPLKEILSIPETCIFRREKLYPPGTKTSTHGCEQKWRLCIVRSSRQIMGFTRVNGLSLIGTPTIRNSTPQLL